MLKYVTGLLGTGVYAFVYQITLLIGEVIDIGFNIYYEACSDGNLEGIVTGVVDGINAGVRNFVFYCLGTVYYGCEYEMTIRID